MCILLRSATFWSAFCWFRLHDNFIDYFALRNSLKRKWRIMALIPQRPLKMWKSLFPMFWEVTFDFSCKKLSYCAKNRNRTQNRTEHENFDFLQNRTEQNTDQKFFTERRTEQNTKNYLFFNPWFETVRVSRLLCVNQFSRKFQFQTYPN